MRLPSGDHEGSMSSNSVFVAMGSDGASLAEAASLDSGSSGDVHPSGNVNGTNNKRTYNGNTGMSLWAGGEIACKV